MGIADLKELVSAISTILKFLGKYMNISNMQMIMTIMPEIIVIISNNSD